MDLPGGHNVHSLESGIVSCHDFKTRRPQTVAVGRLNFKAGQIRHGPAPIVTPEIGYT
jgi:hypothetical protein